MTRGRRRSTAVAALAAAMVASTILLAGCTPAAPASSADGPTLAVYNGASGAFTENFNPLSPTVLSDVQGLVYEPLFFFNSIAPAGSRPVPLLGTSYDVDASGTKVAVTTRSGVRWSDGTAFTARDVAFTMNLIRDTPALNTSGNTPEAVATDATHVTLTFDTPSFTSVPTILGSTYIVPEHIWSKVKDPATAVNENPVGTGPMTIASFTSQSYLLKKNPRYRDASKVRVGGIRLYSLAGNEAATNKLLAGQLDWSGIFIPDVKKVLGSRPDLHYTSYSSQQVVLNTCSNAALGCSGPQTDPVVRRAMSLAIDRGQVDRLAYYGNAVAISDTFLVPGRDDDVIADAYRGTEPMSAQTAKAESLLEGDGWARGSDGIYAKDGQRLSMTVLVTSGYTDYIAALQAITQQLRKAGIGLDVQQVANQENNSAAGLGKFQLQINGIFPGPTTDPYYIYEKYFDSRNTAAVGTSVNPYGNVARFSDPTVDRAIATAASTEDAAVKKDAYAAIQRVITENLPYIPIINNRPFSEYSTRQVTGFPTEENPYAVLAPGTAPDNAQVLLRLRPTS